MKAKYSDICLRINKLQCTNSNVFDEGQEVDIDLIYLLHLIYRNSVELYNDDDDSFQASSNASLQYSSQDMSGYEDDARLVRDDVSYMGSEKKYEL